MGKSAFGPGTKAGGPNYVTMLSELRDNESPDTPAADSKPQLPILKSLWERLESASRSLMGLPNAGVEDINKIRAALSQYDRFAREEILIEHDHFKLVGQDNHRRYLPVSPMRIRVQAGDKVWEIVTRCAAAVASGCRATVSCGSETSQQLIDVLEQLTLPWAGRIEFVDESDSELEEAIREGRAPRIRYASSDRVPESIRRAANENFVYLADAPVLASAPELLWYVVEQSISFDYHRYGNLGPRAEEKRAAIL
jgi:RHH-type proline utilization regulon transcriptional repressor/proline dehydrogenase/delta 1-pyrroline-5-carboxylate dehydrogenase